MGSLDARFNNQIFRKDNPIILACRRDKAVFMGVRVIYDSNGYLPGQVLVRVTATGLFEKWSTASGLSYDSPCVLFDQATNSDQLGDGDGLSGVSGATLLRALTQAVVYTANLVDYDAGAKTALKSTDYFDSGAVGLTKF